MTVQSGVTPDSRQRMQELIRRSILWIFASALTLVTALIVSVNFVSGPTVAVTIGEPVPEDIVVPESTTMVSQILTEERREQAAAAIPEQFTPIDLSLARAQNNYARSVFGYIDVVRADSLASRDGKLRALAAIEGLSLENQVAEDLLTLNQTDYAAARDDIFQIVENTMRQGVFEEQLEEARVNAALGAAFDLTPAQSRIVTALAPQFVVANIFYDEERTNALKDAARDSVEPVTYELTEGQRILQVGDRVEAEHIEILEHLGLLQPRFDRRQAMSAALVALLSTTVITLYWNKYFSARRDTTRSLTIVAILLMLFTLSAKLVTAGSTNFNYLFPAAAFSIIIAVIFEARLALVLTAVLAALVGYIADESLALGIYSAAGGCLAVLTLRDAQRINALFRAGLVAAVGNVAVILIFQLPTEIGTAELLTLILFGLINGPLLSAGLSLAGIFIIGSVFRIVTSLQLQELSRLDHPLLQELLRKAPGTYHHSIMVANLAEQGAEKVKANSPLVRVGSFYHDIGKMNRPPFFSENQNGGNPHDTLDPYSSARIIMSHVTDGLELARRHRLPNRIRDFIAEHHGDRLLKVFFNKAVDAAQGEAVQEKRFRYPGPRPQSRETGIVQLADTIEATSSALRPSTEVEIEKLVMTIVDEHLKEGQLDESGLTLGDIKALRQSFIETLKGRFHVRVRYPGNEALTQEVTQPSGTKKETGSAESAEAEPVEAEPVSSDPADAEQVEAAPSQSERPKATEAGTALEHRERIDQPH